MNFDEQTLIKLFANFLIALRRTESSYANPIQPPTINNIPTQREGPIARLMRIDKLTYSEAITNLSKRKVQVEISFIPNDQKWRLLLLKDGLTLLDKQFTKASKAQVTSWFWHYDLENDMALEQRISWKTIEAGTPHRTNAYVSERDWKKLKLPIELELCSILEFPPNKTDKIYTGIGMIEETGKVIKLKNTCLSECYP